MGTALEFKPEKLVIGVLTTRPGKREELLSLLAGRFGPPDLVSPPMAFAATSYYVPEMGDGILRYFVAFRDPVDPSRLPEIKTETNAMEDRFREDGKRKVNLDPGLLSLARFLLATTKDRAHRIPLRQGIFAELTLLYEKGTFHPLPWTYPDYRSEAYLGILAEVRALFKESLRAPASGPSG
jgi:hypothetical protein